MYPLNGEGVDSVGANRGITTKDKLTTHTHAVKYIPNWFKIKSSYGLKSPHKVSTRILVEDEKGVRYARKAVSAETLSRLQQTAPMGVSIYMPIYLLFIKAVNKKVYTCYACYNNKLKYPLFCVYDVTDLGRLYNLKK